MMLQVTVVQATAEPLELFMKLFGGTLARRLCRYRDGQKVLHTWQVSSLAAETFLREVYPFLRIKKDEADIALAFRATFRAQHVKGGHKRMDASILERRAELSDDLKLSRKAKRSDALAAEIARRTAL